MQNKNTRLGFTQLNKSAVICPPCGESQGQRPQSRKVGMREPGKGVVNKATLLDNPPSALCATSPTLGGKSTTRGFTARSGFTLIELLVVVLIIGILAAVAVPQYQKAVEKSKATQVLSLLKTLYQAQHAYYLANGEFATNFSQLDVDFPYTGKQAWSSDSLNIDTRSNQDWSIQLYKNAGNGRAISAGRVSGPYKGAGFFIYTAGGGSLGEIICAERERGGINFTPPFGRYCATLWGGKLTRGGDLKEYKLP